MARTKKSTRPTTKKGGNNNRRGAEIKKGMNNTDKPKNVSEGKFDRKKNLRAQDLRDPNLCEQSYGFNK